MSRKLLLSSIAIAATATLLGVGAYAKFSDSETSAIHSVTAGTLDLKILNGEQPDSSYPEYAAYSVLNAAPGDANAQPTKQIHFRNVGSLPGALYVKVVMDTNNENGIVEPEASVDNTDAVGELGQNMLVSIDGIGAMQQQRLTDLNAAGPVQWGTLAPGAEGWVSVAWAIPSTVGNEIMSDSATFHLEFSLEQL